MYINFKYISYKGPACIDGMLGKTLLKKVKELNWFVYIGVGSKCWFIGIYVHVRVLKSNYYGSQAVWQVAFASKTDWLNYTFLGLYHDRVTSSAGLT